MIRFERTPEPPRFDEEVRKPGVAWLAAHPDAAASRFPAYWSRCLKDLKAGFQDLCGYSAMWTSRPTVDHYRPRSSREGRPLAYEWDNYRLADLDRNAAKGSWDGRILDPFEVGDDWFEVRLPHLELVLVEDCIPPARREAARFTLKKLGLGDSEEILELRRAWYEDFLGGDSTLTLLSRRAPLIARAVKRRLDQMKPADFDDERSPLEQLLRGEMSLKNLRRVAPRLAETVDAALRR